MSSGLATTTVVMTTTIATTLAPLLGNLTASNTTASNTTASNVTESNTTFADTTTISPDYYYEALEDQPLSINSIEDYLSFALSALQIIGIIVAAWYYGFGLVGCWMYKNRIADYRECEESLNNPGSRDLYDLVEQRSLPGLIYQYPVTFFHFCCCYPSRVADTFYSANLTSFWGAFASMLIIHPLFWCYLPLMRSSVREYLNGENCTMADLLICLLPCTHFLCCYGFLEAVAIDEATGMVPRFPFGIDPVGRVEPFEWPQWMLDALARIPLKRKEKAGPRVMCVGDPIQLDDTWGESTMNGMSTMGGPRVHHFVRSDANMENSRSMQSPQKSHSAWENTLESGGVDISEAEFQNQGKKRKRKAKTAEDAAFKKLKRMEGSWSTKVALAAEFHQANKPIDRPRCMEFMERGKCKNGNQCWWTHMSEHPSAKGMVMDRVDDKRLDCPKLHGLRHTKTRRETEQCNLCQKRLSEVGTMVFECAACRFIACVDCAKNYKGASISLEHVD